MRCDDWSAPSTLNTHQSLDSIFQINLCQYMTLSYTINDNSSHHRDVTNTTLFNSIFLGENSAIEVSEKFWWFFFSNFLLLLLCFIQLQISDVLLVNHRLQCLMVTCAENTHTWMLCDQFFFFCSKCFLCILRYYLQLILKERGINYFIMIVDRRWVIVGRIPEI